jgi:hypothetical protein
MELQNSRSKPYFVNPPFWLVAGKEKPTELERAE